MTAATLHHGDCLDVLRTLSDASIPILAAARSPRFGQ